MTVKSPGGSTFPYFYKNGEIHSLKYGSFFSNEKGLLELMDKEKEFIQKRPNQRLRIWTDFYETNITNNVLLKYIENISDLYNQIFKIAIVGLSWKNQIRLKRLIKKTNVQFAHYQFFKDPEDAKTWLVTD